MLDTESLKVARRAEFLGLEALDAARLPEREGGLGADGERAENVVLDAETLHTEDLNEQLVTEALSPTAVTPSSPASLTIGSPYSTRRTGA